MQGGRFLVTATFTNAVTGAQGTAQGVQLSAESGYFWFFDSTNTELSLKILNGQLINGRSWLFLASMTTKGAEAPCEASRSPPLTMTRALSPRPTADRPEARVP
jgi:hypothetical protein